MAQIVETTFTAEENNQTLAPVPATKTAMSRWRCQVDASWSETTDGIGMGEVSERRVSRVNFEPDCQQLVHIIQQKKQCHVLDPELDEVETMKSAFKEFSITFISRLANVRADGLAKDARSRVQISSFVEVKDSLSLAMETSLYETF
uniref:RNase H type-1 domain-containing protein n=1 Tax=Brassica oleracea var. oleracea TaxID=109376 RepID=A0A0D3CBE8_BRAOL